MQELTEDGEFSCDNLLRVHVHYAFGCVSYSSSVVGLPQEWMGPQQDSHLLRHRNCKISSTARFLFFCLLRFIPMAATWHCKLWQCDNRHQKRCIDITLMLLTVLMHCCSFSHLVMMWDRSMGCKRQLCWNTVNTMRYILLHWPSPWW